MYAGSEGRGRVLRDLMLTSAGCPRAGLHPGRVQLRPARRSARVPTPLVHASQAGSDAQTAPGPTAPATDYVSRADYGKFVQFLHLASPYVVGHRSRVFVIVIPGEVVARKDRLLPMLEDILLLHGLGVRVVIVAGAKTMIDTALRRAGKEPAWEGAYRVTDPETLKIAIEVAGSLSTEVSAHLSKVCSRRRRPRC